MKTIPEKKKFKKAKCLSEEALQIGKKKKRERESKGRGERESECRVPENSKER